MRSILTSALLAAALAVPGVGFAQTPAARAAEPGAGDCALAKKHGRACELTFEQGDTLEGGNPSPGGEEVFVPKDTWFRNLIKLRWSFRDRIIKTAEDLG